MLLMLLSSDFTGTSAAPRGDSDYGMKGIEENEDREEDALGSD